LEVHKKDTDLVYKIQSFFNGIGTFSFPSKKESNLKMNDLVTKIIPHFNNYALQSIKRNNYEL
jgi:hypothetical protein